MYFFRKTIFMILVSGQGFGSLNPLAFAGEMTPEEGIKRIGENIEISSKNKEEFGKAIEQVNENLARLEKSQVALSSQRQTLLVQSKENKKTLELHQAQLKEIEKSRQTEEKAKAAERLKIEQLEKALADLKNTITQRDSRLNLLEQDRVSLDGSKKQGENLIATMNQEIQTLDQRISALKKEMAHWKQKKSAYEKESTRWQKELERHQKMDADVKVLNDSSPTIAPH